MGVVDEGTGEFAALRCETKNLAQRLPLFVLAAPRELARTKETQGGYEVPRRVDIPDDG